MTIKNTNTKETKMNANATRRINGATLKNAIERTYGPGAIVIGLNEAFRSGTGWHPVVHDAIRPNDWHETADLLAIVQEVHGNEQVNLRILAESQSPIPRNADFVLTELAR